MPKPIQRKEDSSGVVGKAVPVNKLKRNFEMIKDIEEEEAEKDQDKPLLNYKNYSMDAPRTTYQDQGDSVQSRILKR